MGRITINSVVPADDTADPVAAPTTSHLAHTTSYSEVLAGYVEVISRLSESRHSPQSPPAELSDDRRLRHRQP